MGLFNVTGNLVFQFGEGGETALGTDEAEHLDGKRSAGHGGDFLCEDVHFEDGIRPGLIARRRRMTVVGDATAVGRINHIDAARGTHQIRGGENVERGKAERASKSLARDKRAFKRPRAPQHLGSSREIACGNRGAHTCGGERLPVQFHLGHDFDLKTTRTQKIGIPATGCAKCPVRAAEDRLQIRIGGAQPVGEIVGRLGGELRREREGADGPINWRSGLGEAAATEAAATS